MSGERPMIGIARRVVLSNKEDITFQVAIDPEGGGAALREVLDMVSDASDRERWKADLAEKRLALRVAEGQEEIFEKQVRELTRSRAAALAGFQTGHQARNKRSEFAMNERQRVAIEQFDAQIAASRQSIESFRNDRPIIAWEIDCLQARIAGEAEPEKPEELHRAMLRLAADAA